MTMTDAFVRIKREGALRSIEIEHLTTEERQQFFKNTTKEESLIWLNFLCENLNAVDTFLKNLKSLKENKIENT